MRLRDAGFTYLWLIFVIAIVGASAAALGQRWTTVAQRDRELELEFRGKAIAAAIASYRAAGGQWPRSLGELVEDRRAPRIAHHLRALYADPFTGKTDWVLVDDGSGGIRGVRSRSLVLAFRTQGETPRADGRPQRVSDRAFTTNATAMPASSAASSAPFPAGSVSRPAWGPSDSSFGSSSPPAFAE